ncbi:hypothetical protein D3C83_91660 [compost metagenome]
MRKRKPRTIASPSIAGARSQNRMPNTSGHGNEMRGRPWSMPRRMRRAARSPLARNGVGPSQRSVIGDAKNPGQTTVTPTPLDASSGRSASA